MTINGEVENDWAFGLNYASDTSGWFPFSYCEKYSHPVFATVLYDYETENGISLKVDDIVETKPEQGVSEWTLIETQNSREGYVPSTYIQKVLVFFDSLKLKFLGPTLTFFSSCYKQDPLLLDPKTSTRTRRSERPTLSARITTPLSVTENPTAQKLSPQDEKSVSKSAWSSRKPSKITTNLPENVAFEGPLEKRGDKGPVKTYKKRHFKLIPGKNSLSYHKSPKDKEELGHIVLSDIEHLGMDPSKQNGFVLSEKDNKRQWFLAASDPQGLLDWVKHIEPLLLQKQSLGSRSRERGNTELPAPNKSISNVNKDFRKSVGGLKATAIPLVPESKPPSLKQKAEEKRKITEKTNIQANPHLQEIITEMGTQLNRELRFLSFYY